MAYIQLRYFARVVVYMTEVLSKLYMLGIFPLLA